MSIEAFAPYSHPADVALLSATPMLMAPRFGSLPPLLPGHSRHIAASDGIYLQARSNVMDITCRLSAVQLPYGKATSSVRLIGGPIPAHILQSAEDQAKAAMPNEWAGLILYRDRRYELWTPSSAAATPSRVSYLTGGVDPLDIVVDLHSHGGGPAFFSRTDDADDSAIQTPCVATGVIGLCHLAQPEHILRYVVGGRFVSTRWNPFTSKLAA